MKHPVRHPNESGCEFPQNLCTQNYNCNPYHLFIGAFFIAPGKYQYHCHDNAAVLAGLRGGQCDA